MLAAICVRRMGEPATHHILSVCNTNASIARIAYSTKVLASNVGGRGFESRRLNPGRSRTGRGLVSVLTVPFVSNIFGGLFVGSCMRGYLGLWLVAAETGTLPPAPWHCGQHTGGAELLCRRHICVSGQD